jgi:hypothetical protein
MMHQRPNKLKISPAQMEALRQYPKHPDVLSELGIQLPEDAIVVIGRHGIRILLPGAVQSAVSPS